MMNRYNNILQIALSAIFLLAGCEKADTAADSDARHTTLRVTTVPMTIVGEQVPYDTRASKPLNPEDENVIYSLAVLVFDESEGVLHKFDKSGKYYKYIDLKDENGNGLLSTKLPIEDFPVQPDETYTICLVANLSEEQVEKIINDMMADGTAFIHEFQEVSVMIPYVAPDKADGQLETGHVREIYMFGYYRGEVSAHGEISISLGRIISRLEIAFTYAKNRKMKHLAGQLEYRYWLSDVFKGHYLGVHATGGIFNFGNLPLGILKDYRLEGQLYGGGLTYGYQWIISNRVNIGVDIGLGYLYVDYDKFYCPTCGERVDHYRTNYLGPTKVGVSIIYLLK